MIARFLKLVAFFAILLWGSLLLGQDSNIIKRQYSINTSNQYEAVLALKKFVENKGGYVSYFSNSYITLRLPKSQVKSLHHKIDSLGYITRENHSKRDMALTLVNLKTTLKNKEKLYRDITTLLGKSKFRDSLEIEKELNRVIISIENLKGSIRFYQKSIFMPKITIMVNQRYRYKRTDRTNWQWINRIGIDKLMRNF